MLSKSANIYLHSKVMNGFVLALERDFQTVSAVRSGSSNARQYMHNGMVISHDSIESVSFVLCLSHIYPPFVFLNLLHYYSAVLVSPFVLPHQQCVKYSYNNRDSPGYLLECAILHENVCTTYRVPRGTATSYLCPWTAVDIHGRVVLWVPGL